MKVWEQKEEGNINGGEKKRGGGGSEAAQQDVTLLKAVFHP